MTRYSGIVAPLVLLTKREQDMKTREMMNRVTIGMTLGRTKTFMIATSSNSKEYPRMRAEFDELYEHTDKLLGPVCARIMMRLGQTVPEVKAPADEDTASRFAPGVFAIPTNGADDSYFEVSDGAKQFKVTDDVTGRMAQRMRAGRTIVTVVTGTAGNGARGITRVLANMNDASTLHIDRISGRCNIEVIVDEAHNTMRAKWGKRVVKIYKLHQAYFHQHDGIADVATRNSDAVVAQKLDERVTIDSESVDDGSQAHNGDGDYECAEQWHPFSIINFAQITFVTASPQVRGVTNAIWPNPHRTHRNLALFARLVPHLVDAALSKHPHPRLGRHRGSSALEPLLASR